MPTLPIRLQKTRIVIQQLDRNMTVQDPDFREPIGLKDFKEAIEVYGQVNFYTKSKYQYFGMDMTMTGDREATAGRITFKRLDLVNAGVTIRKGDKIVSVGKAGQEIEVNGRVKIVNPYSFRNGINLLVSVEFTHDYDTRESVTRGSKS